ncbi:MAG TPA: hypothetical protein VFC80_02650 [Sphaerochaeta sp.]|nr:hypothetical protein [Sphaerochaeta sp.]
MKVPVAVLIVLCIGSLLFGVPTYADVTVAIAAVTDATICAVAAYLNTPTMHLPGLAIEHQHDISLPHTLLFEESDIGSYTPFFRPKQQNFFSMLLDTARGPLNAVALQFLTVHEWEVGHAVLTGVATTEWGEGMTLPLLMGYAISGMQIDPIVVDVDVNVKGSRLSTPVHIVGSFMIVSSGESFIDIEPLSLRINGRGVE